MRSVGVMGDERTYDYAVALRAVETTDFMTADWAQIPFPVLEPVNTVISEMIGCWITANFRWPFVNCVNFPVDWIFRKASWISMVLWTRPAIMAVACRLL